MPNAFRYALAVLLATGGLAGCESAERELVVVGAQLKLEVEVIDRYLNADEGRELGGGCTRLVAPPGPDYVGYPVCRMRSSEIKACSDLRASAQRLIALPEVTSISPDPGAPVRTSAKRLVSLLGACGSDPGEGCGYACRQQFSEVQQLVKAIDQLALAAQARGHWLPNVQSISD